MTVASKLVEYRVVVLAAGVPQIEQATDLSKAVRRAEGFRRGGYSKVSVQAREVSEWRDVA